MAKSIFNFFQKSNNRNVVQACLDAGVRFAEVTQIKKSTYTGKIFVLTGSFKKISRMDAKSMVEKLGARVSGAVSSKTDFVLAGISAGTKLEKARNLGIPILSENEFIHMIEEK